MNRENDESMIAEVIISIPFGRGAETRGGAGGRGGGATFARQAVL